MQEIKKLLPIGSVILLRDAKKKLMIHGIRQTAKESGKEYDYIAVMYPEGNIGGESQVLFNHADIEEILFRGFENEERDLFLDCLEKFYENR